MKRTQVKRFVDGKQVTKKDFLRVREEELKTDYVQQQFLIANKVFSLAEIRSLEKRGLLPSEQYRGAKYFKKHDVSTLIKDTGNPNLRLKL